MGRTLLQNASLLIILCYDPGSFGPHKARRTSHPFKVPGDPQVLWDPRVTGDPQTTTRLTFGGGLMCATLLTGLSRQPNHHQANLRRWAYVRYAT